MISAIILAKNEEKNIEACLKSVSWCDEKIVIDDDSTDKTIEIAKKMGAKIINTLGAASLLQDNFAAKRNLGLEKAKGEWVLFIDADERLSSALWYEITAHVNEPIENFSGFYLKRIDSMWGKELKYGEVGNVKLLRLARKNAGKWEGAVHETWQINGKKGVLNNPLLHYPHQTVAQFLQEVNYYTDVRAKELYEKSVQVNWMLIILYPSAKFILNYFLKAGFLDGLPGLIIALMMSFHSFLVRSKLWTLWEKRPDTS